MLSTAPQFADVLTSAVQPLVQSSPPYWGRYEGRLPGTGGSKATRRDPAALRKIQELCVTVPSMFYGSGHP
ncbi:hypothetical protein, partial [Streptomyces yunnanensis]|uniref:hypothetical protein n=1 Tax=Streptomyces yunnanensis TaxID=156453 RepID=UPI001ABF2F20